MTTIFFKKPVALDRNEHRKMRLKPTPLGYSFAKSINAAPLTITEMAVACADYPIVFTLNPDGTGMPVALLGVRDNENLFVDAEGKWDADYVPGFVRSYPFALHQESEKENALVVMDEGYEGLNDQEGIELFSEDGNPTPHLQQTISALEQFYKQERATLQFVELLNKNGLLVSRVLGVKTANQQKITLDGFYVIDEGKIAEASDQLLLDLARNGGFAFIYAHILSMNSMTKLMDRVEAQLSPETTMQ